MTSTKFSAVLLCLLQISMINAVNLNYLDPTKLQTKTSPSVQEDAATRIISKYFSSQFTVQVNPLLFNNKKDVFALRTSEGILHIRASSGVAAVWGFNYYLKKYCSSHIGWQTTQVFVPNVLPDVDETVVANDRFRYYQNVCTAAYSFVWWNTDQWTAHVEWMALNGINLALAPVAQEAVWTRIYTRLGMSQTQINDYFTGPAFLSWLRMGNVHGWGGPLLPSWHNMQKNIQDAVINYMFQLGMVPVLPAFNGHVPSALATIYPNSSFHRVQQWSNFNKDYCCGSFVEPSDPLFKTIGKMFLMEITQATPTGHVYTADPFNELSIEGWSTELVEGTSRAIYSTLNEIDENAVWLIQNWMFISDPILWPKTRVKTFLTSVPNGRMLVLDLQSEQWPQYDLYDMYFGQPFIWCMLHNFGGTLGMFGSMQIINKDVYEARARVNGTMIGIGLTPEGINQNYVVYDLMLETAWRKEPVVLEDWVAEYAQRRYGCNCTSEAWQYLIKSVYNFNGLNKVRGKYVITRRPSFRIKPWAWYSSHDLFSAFRIFALSSDCNSPPFYHDLVDVTRQALQYRAEQLYVKVVNNRFSNMWVFNSSINLFLDVMNDMQDILASNSDFGISDWLRNARAIASGSENTFLYELNARNQITLWGPNGEISDYACKQWAEMFYYYYIPRWRAFLFAALNAKVNGEYFDEKATQSIVRLTVEKQFLTANTASLPGGDPKTLALTLYQKWAYMPDLEDLPLNVIPRELIKNTTLADIDSVDEETWEPTVSMWQSTTSG